MLKLKCAAKKRNCKRAIVYHAAQGDDTMATFKVDITDADSGAFVGTFVCPGLVEKETGSIGTRAQGQITLRGVAFQGQFIATVVGSGATATAESKAKHAQNVVKARAMVKPIDETETETETSEMKIPAKPKNASFITDQQWQEMTKKQRDGIITQFK